MRDFLLKDIRLETRPFETAFRKLLLYISFQGAFSNCHLCQWGILLLLQDTMFDYRDRQIQNSGSVQYLELILCTAGLEPLALAP